MYYRDLIVLKTKVEISEFASHELKKSSFTKNVSVYACVSVYPALERNNFYLVCTKHNKYVGKRSKTM